MKKGIVYIVGAGPGDPKLISVKGLECIKNADVVVYDRLANKQIINNAKINAEIIYVGKAAGKVIYSQPEINELLFNKAQEGKFVIRLKGGDGFIFGRGGEEAAYLNGKGTNYEIVPGISSAYAVPAYAGIPVTYRGISSSVSFVAGHEDITKSKSTINWSELAKNTDTVVFLMGMKNLKLITEELLNHGKNKNTPVAVIRRGTTPSQKTIRGTLDNISQKIKNAKISPPAIVIIGDVVNLRENIMWYEKKPLFGKKILITRAKDQAEEFANKIYELGGEPLFFPTIKIVDADSYEKFDSTIDKLDKDRKAYDWIIFTSSNAAKKFFRRIFSLGKDIRIIGSLKVAVVGKSTKKVLEQFGIKADFVPDKFVAESIVEGLKKIVKTEEKILFPKAKVTRDVIPDELRKIGVAVDELVVYKTVAENNPPREILDELKDGGIDYITFTSSSTAKNFAKLVGDTSSNIISRAKICSIGPITSKTLNELGYKVEIEAKEYTTNGLLAAITKDSIH